MEERLIRESLIRTDLMFAKDEMKRRKSSIMLSTHNSSNNRTRMSVKFRSEYAAYRDDDDDDTKEVGGDEEVDKDMERMERRQKERKKRERSTAMVEYVERKKLKEKQESAIPKTQAQALALRRKMQNTVQRPSWHPHWKLMRVVSGHLGWVRCIDVEPGYDQNLGSRERYFETYTYGTYSHSSCLKSFCKTSLHVFSWRG